LCDPKYVDLLEASMHFFFEYTKFILSSKIVSLTSELAPRGTWRFISNSRGLDTYTSR
jgi:hypothetical protein